MGDRYDRRNPTVEFHAGVESTSRSSRKDSRELLEARYSKLLVKDAQGWIPARHSASSCTCSDRKDLDDVQKWTSLHRRDDAVTASFGFVGSSFRSEDSEVLALWEEKSEKSPKAVSTDLSWLKPSVELQSSPWRGTVTNAVRKIESAFSRTSPVHPKADLAVESPRPSLEYLKNGGSRSSWRDLKISAPSPSKRPETVLHNSPKARYSNVSHCRVMARDDLESALSAVSPPTTLHHGLELHFAAASRPVDFNLRSLPVDERGDRSFWRDPRKAQLRNENVEVGFSTGQPPMQLEHLSNRIQLERLLSSKPKSIDSTSKPRELPKRAVSLTLNNLEGVGYARQATIDEAAERALSRQSTKVSVEAESSSMERHSSRIRAHSVGEAVLNEFASDAGVQQARAGTQEAGERKPSHRYYQRVTSRERSSRWSSCDDTPLDHIDFVAPSAARFLDDEGCASPVKSPIKARGAVPFKWEKEPGKPKEVSGSTTQSGRALQLPPRLVSRKQHSSPLRNRYINMSMSAPLAGLYSLQSQKPEPESMKVQLPWIEIPTSSDSKAAENIYPPSDCESARSSRMAAAEPPITKSRSVGDLRSARVQPLSRLSANGDAGAQGKSVTSQSTRQHDHEQKLAQCVELGAVRPASPTSILCGPGNGSHPSSNPSLSSEHDAPQVSATAASPMSHSRLPSSASFDSMEHSVEMSGSEFMSPESSLTSPLRANTRCNSMTYNEDFEQMRNGSQKGASSQSRNAFVKYFKTGKRWMKTRTLSKLGTIYSPEVWTPGITIQLQRDADSDFSARLGELSSTAKIDHSDIQIESRFAPPGLALAHLEDIGDRSPAYAATLELLSPVERFSSKKIMSKNRRTKAPPSRSTRKTTFRLRVRARMRARFLVCYFTILNSFGSCCRISKRSHHQC